MLGGFVFPLLGVLILKAGESGAEMPLALQNFAATLSLLTIPLLIFGSFCLSKAADQFAPKQRIG